VLSGLLILTAYALISGAKPPGDAYQYFLCALAGAGYAFATLCLFAGYRIGSMSIVSPIAGSYPAIAVVFGFLGGERPTLAAWLAITAVIVGTLMVSAAGQTHERHGAIETGKLPLVLLLAGATAVFFAVSLIAGQQAVPATGEVSVTWMARAFATLAVLPFFFRKSMRAHAPLKWWPALILMGCLDTLAMLAVFAAGNLVFPELAIVLGGSFGAIVTLLAWYFIKEPVGIMQWLGILLICAGAGVLSVGTA
jgi:drug/metabolite transporter (DMT)-like permease